MGFAAVTCGFLYWAVGEFMCGTQIFAEVYSPNDKYKAVIFERNCGATTNFSTNVSVLRAEDSLPNRPGNVFQIDGHPDWTLVRATWAAPRSLLITYEDDYEVWHQESFFRDFLTGVTVEYQRK
jgi:hypothetical protein